MDTLNNFLFVYGTLLDSRNELGRYLQSRSAFCMKGRLRGYLYDIGEYPGAVYDPSSPDFVYGDVYSLDNPAETLPVLDNYEGFGPEHPHPNEFVRKVLPVEAEGNQIECWVYLYNLPADNLNRIISGSYGNDIK